MEVTFSVILSALIVKSMSHFVPDNHAYGAIVESRIGFRVEERALKNARGKANLVGCRVIISVDCLRSHIPFIPVDGLSGLVGYHLLQGKATRIEHILVETL